jgi:oligoribonuclease NrnB/cAMP/cGMP phosphodiesterase (DHH superfamily)
MFEKAKQLLKKGSQVLQITHANCADGSGCTVVLENCPINLTSKPVKYNEIDSVLEETDFSAYDVVLITDISPSEEKYLDLADNIILVDHHETALRFHNPDKMRYVTQDYCGAVFTAEFAEYVWGVDLEFLYEFLELTNDYDMWIKADPKSDELNMIYYNIWHKRYVKRFIDGDINFTKEEREFIRNRKEEMRTQFENLDIAEIGLEDGCFICVEKFVNEMCDSLMEEEDYKLVFSYNSRNKNCSVRCSYDEVNIGQVLQDLGFGGGHAGAGGMTEKSMDELEKKITKIVEVVKEIIGE